MFVILAALHYIALALGFSGVLLRGIRLKESLTTRQTAAIFKADNLWGLAALLWIVTGLLRAFGGYEKGSSYYLQNHWFYAKMFLFLVVFILEIWPMVTFIQWRIRKVQMLGEIEIPHIKTFIVINRIQLVLVVTIPFIAVCLARNFRF